MKLLISLNTLELETYLKFTNSFIIGLKDYCVNYYEASISDIEKVLNKYPTIELFVSLNKNIFNDDLQELKIMLMQLTKIKIKGLIFYDLSILNMVKELDLDIPLVIAQDHLITNYNICNYYCEKGVEYAYLSSDITKDEIIEISKKSNIKLMTFFFGNILITHSKRKLLTNYYEYYNIAHREKSGLIKEKNKEEETYYIEENKIGTNILTKKILNGADFFYELKDKIEYAILDSNVRDDKFNNFLDIVELYSLALKEKISEEEFVEKNKKIMGKELYSGFFDKKTIYKVK